MKRTIIAISLFLVLTAPFLITMGLLKHHQLAIRHEVKSRIIAGIDRAELTVLTFSKQQIQDELEWEHSKEFEYQGEKYDIVSFEEFGDSITYYCWWDHEETYLEKQLDELVNRALGNHENHQREKDSLCIWLKTVYNLTENQNTDITLFYYNTQHTYKHEFSFKELDLIPPTPPPDLS